MAWHNPRWLHRVGAARSGRWPYGAIVSAQWPAGSYRLANRFGMTGWSPLPRRCSAVEVHLVSGFETAAATRRRAGSGPGRPRLVS